ncbi:MAG: substrate-binding domain-containing protein [Propionibacteriaceae bacterium]|jgi:DNA-binding LacI/PurR family transcriptional regulator|nr:substrate-binding domain-containing protein [Propionibacteriaceae bacterium]
MTEEAGPGTPEPKALAGPRREQLLALVRRRDGARVADLAAALNVTTVTIRRDLERLAAEGRVERVHGGARPIDRSDRADRSAAPADPPSPGGKGARLEGQVAMLVPGLDFYWPAVARAAEAEAKRHGLRLLLRGDSYESVDERPALAPLFEAADVRGVLAVPNVEGQRAGEVIDWITRQRAPCVLMEREAVAPSLHRPVESVASDHALGAELALRHLWGLGHRRLGLVVSRNSPTTRKIRLGFERGQAELGLDPAAGFDALIPDTRTAGFAAAIDAVIDRVKATAVTGLLVHSDREAMGLVQRLEIRGLAVPGDLSVVAYDDEVAGLFTPALTAVRPARQALGTAGVRLLVERLLEPDRPVHRMTISPEIFCRESTAAPHGV